MGLNDPFWPECGPGNKGMKPRFDELPSFKEVHVRVPN